MGGRDVGVKSAKRRARVRLGSTEAACHAVYHGTAGCHLAVRAEKGYPTTADRLLSRPA